MTIQEIVDRGKMYRDEGMYDQAYRYFLEGAIANDPESIENLGLLYLYGEGVDQDDEKAFHYYRMYYDMTGEKDMFMNLAERRVELFERESGRRLYRELLEYMLEQKEWEIYIFIGHEYTYGIVYPKDVKKAIECYKLAISHGISVGYECLGEMYYLGEDVKQDYKKAYEYFQSCEGFLSFMKPFYLGEMYRLGLYVKKDLKKAEEQYRTIVDSRIIMKTADRLYEPAVAGLRSIVESRKG